MEARKGRAKHKRQGGAQATVVRVASIGAADPSVTRRLAGPVSWASAIALWVRERLLRVGPGAVRGTERLLCRAGRVGRIVAFAAAASLPLVVTGVRIGWVAWDRGRYLTFPPRWEATLGASTAPLPEPREEAGADYGVGGVSDGVVPLRIMTYSARSGDTLSGIAGAFGLELDTISSLNRDWGNGVHTVSVGESIRIPNQDGIYLAVDASFEDLCDRYGLLPETVLAANGKELSEVRAGTVLFFPGVQHSGAMREMFEGRGFFYPLVGWLSSRYGYRTDPFDPGGKRRIHYGVDLAAPVGTPVRAARSGTIWLVGEDDVFGKQILIGHEFRLSTFYAHLDRIVVERGQRVTNRTVIGYVGTSGRVTGPHLHFEIRSGGAPINPSEKLTPTWY